MNSLASVLATCVSAPVSQQTLRTCTGLLSPPYYTIGVAWRCLPNVQVPESQAGLYRKGQ